MPNDFTGAAGTNITYRLTEKPDGAVGDKCLESAVTKGANTGLYNYLSESAEILQATFDFRITGDGNYSMLLPSARERVATSGIFEIKNGVMSVPGVTDTITVTKDTWHNISILIYGQTGRTYLTLDGGTPIEGRISSLGAIPLVITAEEHDFITAGVSHLPHIVASALVNLVNLLDNDAQYMKMIAAGGFRDITRIASSSPVMWEQICLENQKNISTVLDEFIRMLIQIRCSIDNKEADNIFDMFASSKDYRDSIDIVDNSLIPRSYVLYIDVADEAGAIATIATILATEKVSIKNIGIIHNREFEDGVLKIEFYTDAALEQAKVLLTKRNYKICER